jgi:hypothetical protein
MGFAEGAHTIGLGGCYLPSGPFFRFSARRDVLPSTYYLQASRQSRKGVKIMAIRRGFIGLAIVSIVVIGICFLGSVPQATAETLTYKTFTHVTKSEMVPIGDVEGHFIGVLVREGATIFGNGEWAWMKGAYIRDLIKGAGAGDSYITYTFLDKSTITVHRKGTMEATPAGVTSASKWAGDIIGGTGRFQGIKGSVTSSSKILPPEQGEPMGKGLSEGTFVYTLLSK